VKKLANTFPDVRNDHWIQRLRSYGFSREATNCMLNAVVAERTVAAKRDIIRNGAYPDSIVVLMEGWACRYRLLPDGSRHICTLFLPGDVCDYAALDENDVTCGVSALSDCTVCDIAVDRLDDRPGGRKSVVDGVARITAGEVAILTERAISIGRRSAFERVAHLLCELTLRLKAIGHGTASGFRLVMTQEDMADMLGLTAVHLNRTLHALRAPGLIDIVDRHIVIADWPGLQAAAAFDEAYLGLGEPSSANVRHFPAHDGAAPPPSHAFA
jgi:CRP-like cAMP-binding protein